MFNVALQVEFHFKTNSKGCYDGGWYCESGNCGKLISQNWYDVDYNPKAAFCQREGIWIWQVSYAEPFQMYLW